jgi:hypothetical protein
MIAPIHTKPLFRKPKPKVKSQAQFDEYLEYVSKPSPTWSLSKFLYAFAVTIIASVTLFYTVGPDQASVNTRLIIRYNNAQLSEQFIVIKHLMSPMPWEK